MIEPFVVEGVVTDDLNRLMADYISKHDAIAAPLNYMGYPKETCISINDVVCHGIPDDRVLKQGDILNIDVTTILNGYYGDTSRMYSVGEISKEAQRLLEVTNRSLNIGIAQVKPGNKTGLIGSAISEYAEGKGYGVVHQFCGHGVGLMFHEPPQISHKCNADSGVQMVPGMIFTIEPMINIGRPEAVISETDKWTATTIDGELSAQAEHTILVTEDGHEILTSNGAT
jgi:methionyl aminopeptidase